MSNSKSLIQNCINAVKICFSKFADFKGRATLGEYWCFMLAYYVVFLPFSLLSFFSSIFLYIGALISVAFAIPSFAVSVRRMHDIGKSGWWLLINLIPLAGIIIWILNAVKPGEPGPNRYGLPSQGI